MLFAFANGLFSAVFQEVFHNTQIAALSTMWVQGGQERSELASSNFRLALRFRASCASPPALLMGPLSGEPVQGGFASRNS